MPLDRTASQPTPPPARPRKPRNALEAGRVVYLRYPEPEDRAEFVRVRRASREHLAPWEPLPPRGFDAFGSDAFDQELQLQRTESNERLLICSIETRALVGRLSISAITRGALQDCRFGYWVAHQHWGKGYMTEAVGLGLRHCFRRLRLHRVSADIQPHNEGSKRAVARNGFRLEGYSPRLVKIHGRWADHERWAITIEDWTDRASAPLAQPPPPAPEPPPEPEPRR